MYIRITAKISWKLIITEHLGLHYVRIGPDTGMGKFPFLPTYKFMTLR